MNSDRLLINRITKYLKQLDLSPEQTSVYIFLLQNGPSSVLTISRGLKTGRTKLYPLLEDLAKKQMVAIHERHYGTSYEAHSPEVLEFLISEKEQKANSLRSSLPAAVHALKEIQQHSPKTSKIIEYRGVDGLKQMNWNITKAESEFRVFELKNLSNHLGQHFAEKLHSIWAEKKTTSYDLTNNPDWKINTKVTEYSENYSQARYIDPKVFNIQFETAIYNNCVMMINYEAGDIFGVEIYNEKLAQQQKQLFDLLWAQSKIIKD